MVNPEYTLQYHTSRDLPKPSSLVCCPRQHGGLLGRVSSIPESVRVVPIYQILEARRPFKHDDFLLGFGTPVFEGWDVSLGMHAIVPLRRRVNY